jgi:hypothetical protein
MLCLTRVSLNSFSHDLYTHCNPYIVQTTWDIDRYADSMKHVKLLAKGAQLDQRENELARLSKYFELPQNFGHQHEPAVVLDKHGRIVIWYLPNILSEWRLVSNTSAALYLSLNPETRRITIEPPNQFVNSSTGIFPTMLVVPSLSLSPKMEVDSGPG